MHNDFAAAIAQTSRPPVHQPEDCYRGLIAAVLLQAHKDLKRPGYRRRAAAWLRSETAKQYAEMLGVDPAAVQRLLRVPGAFR